MSTDQFAYFEFCMGKHHQLMAHAKVEALKVMPQKGWCGWKQRKWHQE